MKELSGIELREAVAVKVMGWKPCPHEVRTPSRAAGSYDHDKAPVEFCHACGVACLWGEPTPADPEDDLPPAYESDIAAAWLVVEKMREKGYHPRTRDCGEKRQWAFYDHKSGHEREHRWAVCNKDPEAICRAALAAMEAK